MARYTLTPAAKADLRNIRIYLTERAGPETADRFIAEIEGKCALLAKMPGLGAERPEYDPEVRAHPHEKYVIFYFHRPFGATIARVYHSSRDPGGVFKP